jgi:hypothetical protein
MVGTQPFPAGCTAQSNRIIVLRGLPSRSISHCAGSMAVSSVRHRYLRACDSDRPFAAFLSAPPGPEQDR